MKNHNDIYISLKTPYLATFWFSSYGPECCWPITLQDSLKCNISRKKRRNIKAFEKLMPSFLVAIVRYAKSTQNNKFAISLQYLKEDVFVD